MRESFTFGTALYHPYIDIEDAGWLRNAVLFWDHIQTIVPSGIESPYKNADTHILQQEGYLSPLRCDLHGDLLNDLGRRFIQFIDNPDEELFGLSMGSEPAPGRRELLHAGKFGYDLRAELGGARLHPSKLSPELLAMFGSLQPDKDGFLPVDPRFAASYMSVLAASLAENAGLSPLSNEGEAFGANLRTIVGDVGSNESEHANGALVSIAMENLVIDPAIPIEQLLGFRRSNTAQLERLAVEFHELSSNIKGAKSDADLQRKAKQIYGIRVRPRLEALKETLRDQSIGSVWGGMTLAATVVIGVTTSLVGSLLLGAGAFLTLSNFAVQSRLTKRKARRDSPFTYLADLERNYTIPKNLIED